ncbi:MAG: four helix bundle protein [Deltaproteobacteria bacterium]|nr:four helix bundle protein [Deltaproteobacteria bacterium]
MLRIYEDVIELVRELRPVLAELAARDANLAARDANLADQMKRALCSVPLNLAEGAMLSGGNRNLRYRTALGSLREALACVEVGVALGELSPLEAGPRDRFEKIKATLINVVR